MHAARRRHASRESTGRPTRLSPMDGLEIDAIFAMADVAKREADMEMGDAGDDDADPDKRVTQQQADAIVEHPAEFAGGRAGE